MSLDDEIRAAERSGNRLLTRRLKFRAGYDVGFEIGDLVEVDEYRGVDANGYPYGTYRSDKFITTIVPAPPGYHLSNCYKDSNNTCLFYINVDDDKFPVFKFDKVTLLEPNHEPQVSAEASREKSEQIPGHSGE
jgi:hypothetical protein